jgi:hypothetical protein
MRGRKTPCPARDVLEAEYARQPSMGDAAKALNVSLATFERWCAELGITGRQGAAKVAPERRRGGRRYTSVGRPKPGHVSLEQARALRARRQAYPAESLEDLRAAVGVTCSREMVRLVLAGKRVQEPQEASAPPAPLPPAPERARPVQGKRAPLQLGRVLAAK